MIKLFFVSTNTWSNYLLIVFYQHMIAHDWPPKIGKSCVAWISTRSTWDLLISTTTLPSRMSMKKHPLILGSLRFIQILVLIQCLNEELYTELCTTCSQKLHFFLVRSSFKCGLEYIGSPVLRLKSLLISPEKWFIFIFDIDLWGICESSADKQQTSRCNMM